MKKVVLDRALYRMNAVKQAAEAFSELASIEVKPSGKDKIAVKIQPTDEETAAVVVDEFLNYALVETLSDRG